MTTCLGKSCSLGLPRVPFVNSCQFMYLVISLLVLRAGCGIWLYRFLIIAYLFTLFILSFLKYWKEIIVTDAKMKHILSICEQLPLTRVNLKQEHIWIFLDRDLPSVHLSCLWGTVLRLGATENGVCHTWMHDTLSLMNTRCFHLVLWELDKWWWFLKVWASLALFDEITEIIIMAFSRNIFQAYTGMFVLENNVFIFW